MNKWDEILDTYNLVCGVDEVGRGCFAGPVVACAVIMPKEKISGIKDSKKLTKKKREYLSEKIKKSAIAIGVGMRDPEIIDKINIKQATRLAMKEAVFNLKSKENIAVTPEYILIDAESVDIDIPQLSIIGGDNLVYPISCASIVAKVFRDELMTKMHKIYPEFLWKNNKGYGTKAHCEAIKKYGITPLHRKTFLHKLLRRMEDE